MPDAAEEDNDCNTADPGTVTSPNSQEFGAAYLKQQQLLDFEIPSDVSLVNLRSDCRDADSSSSKNMNNFSNTLLPKLAEDNMRLHIDDRTIYNNEGNQHVMEDEKRASSQLTSMTKASEDEFNWRKYGQKQIKGNEYKQSYYKCTHSNCEAKKKVERARNGNITQIIYKDKHNHPKPIPRNTRLPPGSAVTNDER